MSSRPSDSVYYDTSSSELRDAALAPSTLRSYNLNLNKFLTFTRLSLPKLIALPASIVDQRLSEYIDVMFAQRGSFDYACQALFGLIYRHPPLRLHLGEARMRLRGWKRLKQHRSHPPITYELTIVFAATMSKWGRHAEAVATLLAFDCFLRVGELTRLQYHDVVMPNDPRLGSADYRMAVRLAKAKTGLNQSVSLNNKLIESTLHSYLLSRPFLEKDRIFPFTPSSFRTLIRQVAAALGLGDIPYVPHSFRHGGATYAHLRGATIEQIMYRGRWMSLESARRYIQTARALLIMLTIPERLNTTGAALAPHVDVMMQWLMNTVPYSGQADRRVWFRAHAWS